MKTVCGLDLDKSMILMCVLQTNWAKVIQEFSTLTVDVESMRDLMKEHCVEEVGMEMRIYCEKYFKKELLLLCTIPDIQLLSAMIIKSPTHLLSLGVADFNNDRLMDLVSGGMHTYPPFDRMSRVDIWMNNGKLTSK